jgi:hypothetical protein
MTAPVLFDSDHTFEPGEWIAFESFGERQTAQVTSLENNFNHLWLNVVNPDGFSSVPLKHHKRHCVDARRVTERGLHAETIPAQQPVIRQRSRVRA